MSKTLDEMLINTRSFRRPRDHEDISVIWQEYEFGTGAGNREEIIVTNISLHILADITENINISINNWQFLQTENSYFIYAEKSTLIFYKINWNDLSIERTISISIEGHILQFKILNFKATFNESHRNNLMAIVLVETQYDCFLHWYNIFGNTYILYSTWPVRKQIQDMEFLQEKNQHELLLLDNDDTYLEDQSLIDIYGFDVDYNNHRIDIWFCQRLFIPKVFDVQVCPIYGRTVLAFQGIESVILYESKHEDKLCQYKKLEVIKSNKLANFVCFESGYIEYLAISGGKPRLFHFFENEFQNNSDTNLHFDGKMIINEILWIITIPLNTYRDESLLLVQLKNSTIIALAWHGSKFKAVPLPNQVINNFDLSKIIVIPNVGFAYVNMLVTIEVTLTESAHPIHDETESVLKTRALLKEIFRKQETIFDETDTQFNQSYFKNVITGFWNLSKINVSNAILEGHVHYGAVKVGSINLKMEDIVINVTSNIEILEELEAKLDQMLLDLKSTTNSTKIILLPDVELNGDFLVNGTLYTKNIITAFINNASTSVIENSIVSRIIVQKSVSSIDTNNLTIFSLNGIPLEKIMFDFLIKNYSDVNFSILKRLKIDGHLNFSVINSIKWKEQIQNIVWKDESTTISGETIMEKLVAEKANVKNLNYLQYPRNYVLMNELNKFSINITGEKHFVNLSMKHLLTIKTINKIDINDFVILNRHEIINEEITFKDLEIDEIFQIDGNIIGINASDIEDLLNVTDKLLSDVSFENLIIMGNIVLKDSINAKAWSDFDNFLLKTEKNALIIGNKRFWNDVNIKSTTAIKSRRINNHIFSEFVTLNTNQQFPHLTKISANIMFENVTLGIMKKLEDYIIYEQNITSNCFNKILLFVKSFIIDNLSFDTIKQTISQITFFDKLNKTFQQAYFENLMISTLMIDEILPNTINRINYIDLVNRVLTSYTQQNLTGALIIDKLETDILDAEIINTIPLNTWNLSTNAKLPFNDIFNGNASIKNLEVTGIIMASSINNNNIIDIYKEYNMATVIFNTNVSIENLKIIGFINNLNLSMFITDAVQKVDRNITFMDRKTLNNITCEFLKVQFINKHFVNHILDLNEKQMLKGPIIINGLVTVLRNFNTTGKIGNSVLLSDFTNRFKDKDNSYVFHGNVHFIETASVTRLNVSGSIQGSMLNNFFKTMIFKNDTNVTIFGLKLFKNSVTFNNAFNIDGSLNNLDLYRFYENVVYINKPFSINIKVMFRENVYLRKNLVVKNKLQPYTIMEVDMKDFQENVIALNKPKYFPARITLNNVTFQIYTNIKVMQVNDLQMNLLILLNTRQFIMIDKLNCTNIIVRNIQISGHVNTYHIEDIYADTFMTYGNQNITGYIKLQGNIYAYHNFNAHLINNFKSTGIVSSTANDALTGNFMFKTPVILDKNLMVLGLLNRINPINWQGAVIKTINETKQIISGKWRVHGNVYFEKNVDGNEILNEINITDTSSTLTRKYSEINHITEETYKDLNNVCALHLDILKCNAIKQIYKFNTFDYLKIQEFDGNIHNIHTVEINDMNYILINYNICHIKLLLYTQTDFQVIDEVSDFGLINQWMFFKLNRVLYLLTTVKRTCGRSLSNLWKLENNRIVHVLELDNATDIMNLYQDGFIAMIQKNLEIAPSNMQLDIKTLISYKNETLNLVSNNEPIVLTNQSLSYDLQERSLNDTCLKNCFGCGSVLTFKVGINKKEEYIHYNEKVSQDYIYLCKNDISQTKILQTIKARQPKSFLVLNFDGFLGTLLVFVENNDIIQVYEYKGIEGFVHRNIIQIKVDKLYNFKVRNFNNLGKRHFLAAIHKNRLTILEVKMHGEKLNSEMSSVNFCYTNKC
ncbi:PREDICTED: uncharacterized protein LOC105620619 [Atta cephalotes]|uniref:Uncharacterized protein n=1 Tax=Atta cephalotes TaxID=12957 RepID=A0A158NIZ0_ATTCE|nr:PREDICTED: uncharacterized protein LOC105620619 [Atta cephalotes]